MPVEHPYVPARFNTRYNYLIHNELDGIHKFLRENPVFLVKQCDSYGGHFYKIKDRPETLDPRYVELILDDLYVVVANGEISLRTMEDTLRVISELPDGTKWSFYPASNPSEVTLCP